MKRPLLLYFLLALSAAGCRSTAKRHSGSSTSPQILAVRSQSPGRLVLSDASLWQVQPAGQSASLRWRAGDAVRVVRSGHPAWPFLLTHTSSRASALARPAPRF